MTIADVFYGTSLPLLAVMAAASLALTLLSHPLLGKPITVMTLGWRQWLLVVTITTTLTSLNVIILGKLMLLSVWANQWGARWLAPETDQERLMIYTGCVTLWLALAFMLYLSSTQYCHYRTRYIRAALLAAEKLKGTDHAGN